VLGGRDRLGPAAAAILGEGERVVDVAILRRQRDGLAGVLDALVVFARRPVGEGDQLTRQVVVCLGKFGLETDGFAVGGDRLRDSALSMEGEPEIAMGFGEVGLDADGGPVFGDRLVKPPAAAQGIAQIGVGPR
jgi:hypothetical protein